MYGLVEVVLGQYCAAALVLLEIRRGSKGQPFATRTMLGWSLNGPVAVEWPTSTVISNFIYTSYIDNTINPLCNISSDYDNVRSLEGVRCSDILSNVVHKSLYVDDCPLSTGNEQEA